VWRIGTENAQSKSGDVHLALWLVDGAHKEGLELEPAGALHEGNLIGVKRANELVALDQDEFAGESSGPFGALGLKEIEFNF
jgi:hypothetical protein